ncbi:hypothetical protein C8Q72DRAFT_130970 [Fomitopsis betulina]|nr:hypothetical protein C8Q72DRAFT_130970 [Fomitopsis betulina]
MATSASHSTSRHLACAQHEWSSAQWAYPLVGRKLDMFFVVARTFYMIASRALDIQLMVNGGEHLETRPAVLIRNHQSMLDILHLGRCVCSSRALHETLPRAARLRRGPLPIHTRWAGAPTEPECTCGE